MKPILVFVIFLFNTLNAISQPSDGRHEICLGIGAIPGSDIVYVLGYPPDAGHLTRYHKPVYAVSYRYTLSREYSLGMGVSQHAYSQIWYNLTTRQMHEDAFSAFTACAELKKLFFSTRKPYFQYYQILSLGTIKFKDVKQYFVSFYYAPVGLRIGNKNALFLEMGIGYKGLIHGGYSCRLGKIKEY